MRLALDLRAADPAADRIKELPAMTVAKADDPRCYVGDVVEATETDDGLAIKGALPVLECIDLLDEVAAVQQ